MSFVYVGINCHKDTHNACIKNCFNEILDRYTFKNKIEDFKNLETIVKKIKTNNKQILEMEKQIVALYDELDVKLYTFVGQFAQVKEKTIHTTQYF